MTNRFSKVLASTAIAAGVGLASTVGMAQDAKPVTAPPAAAAKPATGAAGGSTANPTAGGAAAPAEASKPASWIGLPVVTADGQTLGQVTELKAAADGKSQVLMVKSPADSKVFAVPSSIAKMTGRAVQLSATSQELKTSVQ
jgi:hypothetical protein